MLAKYLSAKPLITLKFRFLYVGTLRLLRLKECLVWVRKRSYFGLKYLFSSPQTAGEVRNCANIFLKNHPVGSHVQMLEPRLEQRSLALQPYHLHITTVQVCVNIETYFNVSVVCRNVTCVADITMLTLISRFHRRHCEMNDGWIPFSSFCFGVLMCCLTLSVIRNILISHNCTLVKSKNVCQPTRCRNTVHLNQSLCWFSSPVWTHYRTYVLCIYEII